MRPPKVHLERMVNGGYRVTYTFGGKRHRYTLQTFDQKEAEALAAQLQARLLSDFYGGKPSAVVEPLTLAGLAKMYKSFALSEPAVSAVHSKRQSGRVDSVVAALGGSTRMDRLDSLTIEGWIKRRLGEVSPTTVRNDSVALRAMLTWAHKRRKLDHVPYFDIPKGKANTGRTIPLDHVKQILNGLDLSHPRDRAIYLAINTGMRPGDLSALEWADIDTKTGVLRLMTQKREVELVFPLPWGVVERLNPHRGIGLVCRVPDTTGSKRRTRALCGTGYGLRVCRPTFATALYKAGADFLMVKLLMAHKVSDVTAGYIVGGDIQRLRDTASLLPWLSPSAVRTGKARAAGKR